MATEHRESGADRADEEVGTADALAPKVEKALANDRLHLAQDITEKRIAGLLPARAARHPHRGL